MVKGTTGANSALDMDFMDLDFDDDTTATATHIHIVYEEGWYNDFSGSFIYRDGELVGGTLNAISETVNGKLRYTLSGATIDVPTFLHFIEDQDINGALNYILQGDDSLSGAKFADHLYAFGGNDTITGLAGADTLDGGIGTDKIDGGANDDSLIGGAGADTLTGGTGNDLFIVDDTGDKVIETSGGGADTVQSSVSFSGVGQNIEAIVLTGTHIIDATGQNLANTLIGNNAANRLDGGTGADTLTGGKGNDIFIVDNAHDKVIEASGGGNDTVQSSVTFSGVAQDIETILLTGKASINATGQSLANILTGATGANALDGGIGNDTLDGALGNDKLTGGAGKDLFVFDTALSAKTNIDNIVDFVAADDTIRLDHTIFGLSTGKLSATAFASNKTGLAGDGSDRIIYDTDNGNLYYDSNGDAVGGGVLFATLAGHPAITAADFIVI